MKINHHSNKETCVDTYMELEQLREATRTDSKEWRGKLKEIFQKKYRYVCACNMLRVLTGSDTLGPYGQSLTPTGTMY